MSKKKTTEVFDIMACARALDYLFLPGHVYELRVLGAKGGRGILSGYFDSPDMLIMHASQFSGKAEGVYLVLNPVLPRLLDRSRNRLTERFRGGDMTLNEEVVERHWLLVDCDPIKPKGLSSTDEEHELALARAGMIRNELLAKKCPWRMLLADSGNGAHLLLNWVQPNDDNGEFLASAFLRALDARYSDDRVRVDTCTYNANRLCKLYGTLAMKGDPSPTNPHRIARLLEEITDGKRTFIA